LTAPGGEGARMSQQDSGLWKRGLVLLALMAALAGVVLYAVLHHSEPAYPPETARPEPVVLLVGSPAAGLAGGLSWVALYQLGELLPSSPGWEIRYNATLTQAGLGDPQVRLEVLREMLDEQRQLRNFRAKLQDGREVPDEVAARRTVLSALKAVRDWHKHADAVRAADKAQRQLLSAAIDRLADSPNRVVSAEAQETRLALKKG
jgi:hypothetical protein